MKKQNCCFMLFAFLTMMLGVLLPSEVHAATSGVIPSIPEGSITWSLDDAGVLTFAGKGKTNIGSSWSPFWSQVGLDKTSVRAVKATAGSEIQLDTCWSMFDGFSEVTGLDLSNFDTSQVTNMSAMFRDCYKLAELDVSNFDTSQVVDMSFMFYCCDELTRLDLINFDTSQVVSMRSMFASCSKLEELYSMGFDTSQVTNMSEMFIRCESLWNLDLRGFDTQKVVEASSFVEGCTSLLRIVVEYPVFNVAILGEYEYMVTYIKLEQYTITYHNLEDATNTENLPTEYICGRNRKLPVVKRSCYPFGGWYLDESFTQKIDSLSIAVWGDINLYAKWENPIHSNTVKKNEVAATCSSTGYTGDDYCNDCHTVVGEGVVTPKTEHDYDRENGTVTVQPTATTEGSVQYTCKNCPETITEVVSKPAEDTGTDNPPKNEEGIRTNNPSKENASDSLSKITDETILSTKGDGDISGSSFSSIQARADKTTKNTIHLKWNKVKGADGYIIYGNKCGTKNQYEKIKTITKKNTTSYTHKKLKGKKLKKGTYYKYIVRAYKKIDGKKVTIAASKTIHATTTGGKYGDAKSVKLKTDSKLKLNKKKYTLTLKKDKKTKKYKNYTLKASQVKKSGKIKKHREIVYESTNTEIATVSRKGVVKAKKKGTCYIYVYAQNGVYQKIKVKVK